MACDRRAQPVTAYQLLLSTLLPFLLFLTSHAVLQSCQPIGNIAIANVATVNVSKGCDCIRQLAHLFVGGTEFILQRLGFLRVAPGCIQALLEPDHGSLRYTFLHEAVAQHIATLKEPVGTV